MKTIFVLLFGIVLFLTGCKNNNIVEAPNTSLGGGLFLKISPDNRPENVTTVIATLTRPGHESRISTMNLLSDTSAQTSFTGLQAGSWFLKIEARDIHDTLVYYGETNVEVQAGLLTQVSLVLNPVGGGNTTGDIQIIVTWGAGTQPNNWSVQHSGTGAHLQSVFFLNENLGWAAGEFGVILKTTNGGSSWVPQISGVSQRLNWIRFTDPNNGWAVGGGGKIIRTTNGGAAWTLITTGTTQQLFQLIIQNDKIWIVGDNGTILSSHNNGQTWTFYPTTWNANFYAIDFENSITGMVGGTSGTFFSWNDSSGAGQWRYLNSNASLGWIQSIKYTSPNTIVAVAGAGLIHRSTNGGIFWNRMSSGTNEHLEDMVIASENLLYVAGDHGTVLKSTNAGITWQKEPKITNNWLNSIYFTDANHGWAVGNNGTIIRYRKL